VGNLFVSLLNSTGAMRVFERGMHLTQNNISNSLTPGYVKQRQAIESNRFELDSGQPGGVHSAGTLDSRNLYAEQRVRLQASNLGMAQRRAEHLGQLEPIFQIEAGSGLAGALDRFFESASALANTPNDTGARQLVLDRAAALAATFRSSADNLVDASNQLNRDLDQTVEAINAIGARLREINIEYRKDSQAQKDAGLEAKLHSTLEELSQLADYTALRQDDGTVSVYLGGQTLFVLGEHDYPISLNPPGATAEVLDSESRIITAQFGGGALKGALDVRNELLPQYQADLDRLAGVLADSVNGLLASGLDASGANPITPLFQYNATLGISRTLTTNNLAPGDLAVASAGAPGGNGNAIALAELQKNQLVDGYSFTGYYGLIAGRLGRELAGERENVALQSDLLSQTQALREEISAVNLDEEAILLLQYQRGYQASARLVSVLNEMTETVINLLR